MSADRVPFWFGEPAGNDVPTRKIHLDFHNSHHIGSIGHDFEAARFAETMRAASVDAVVLFAKDMHGYFYYPSQEGPEHPAISGRDILGEQIAACHSAGIQVHAYYCTTWDNYLAVTHPEWLSIRRDGSTYLPQPGEVPGWTALCMSNEGFMDLMITHIKEILERYTVEGLWFDMPVTNRDQECFCDNCLSYFAEAGLDAFNRDAQGARTQQLLITWLERVQLHTAERWPDLVLDHNQQTRLGLAARAPYLHNIDVEALPTGEWGYGYFPLMSRYVRGLGLPFTGLTGRFLTSWADFGGLKSTPQLRVELAAIVAAGGGVSIGDQLHPSGALDDAVYTLIGDGYRFIDEVGPLLSGSVAVTEAVLLVAGPECTDFARIESAVDPEVRAGALGLCKLLVEHRVQFDVAEPGTVDLGRYSLIVIPDGLPMTAETIAEIDAFRGAGGRILHVASLRSGGTLEPWLASLGIAHGERSPFSPAYMRLEDDTLFDFALYAGAMRWSVEGIEGTKVLAWLGEPAFQRSAESYTSHLHAPIHRQTGMPAALVGERTAAIAFPIGRAYLDTGYWVYSRLFESALKAVLDRRLITSQSPPSLELTVRYLPATPESPARMLVHAVNFTAGIRRGTHLEFFDEIVPLHNVPVVMSVQATVTAVRTARANDTLDFEQVDGELRFTLPRIDVHEVVEIDLVGVRDEVGK